ncbi:hypothetical protein CHS0354_025912 [Potamilus streckersoni]|uniref:Uncharacterized protein n=1 Tax=Potamilus streckersoni TaxID=2493646 RepID=A0AAE0T3V2_9BIVA|nr:hypothetical protein CHS0354_025912 [Potamilus streckersoni]
MSTFLDTEASCSCTFSTNARRIKVMTLRAPNYFGCGSAVDIKVGLSGLRIECLMSGTSVDMTQYREGNLVFSAHQMFYDSNYCLVLEPDLGSSETITMKCIDPYLPTETSIIDVNIGITSGPRGNTAAIASTILVASTRVVTPATSTTTHATSLARDAVKNTTTTEVKVARIATTKTSISTSVDTNNTVINTTERENISLHTLKTTAITLIRTSTEAILVAPSFNSSTKEAYKMNTSVSNTEETTSVLDNITSFDNEIYFFPGTSPLLRDHTANNATTDFVMNVTVQAVSPVILTTKHSEHLASEKTASALETNITMDIKNETTSPFVAHSVKATSRTPSKGTTSTRYTVASTLPVQSTTYENPRIANLTMNNTRSREKLSSIFKMSHQEIATLSMPSDVSEFASQSSVTGTSSIANTKETITMTLKEINITKMLQFLTSGEIITHQMSTVTDPATDSTTKHKDPSTYVSLSTEYGVKSVLSRTAEVDISTQPNSVDGTSGTTTRRDISSFLAIPKTVTNATSDSTTDESKASTKTVTTTKQTETVAVKTIMPVKPSELVKFEIAKVTGVTKQNTKVTQKQTTLGPKLHEKVDISTRKSIQIMPSTDGKVNTTVYLSNQKDSETMFDRAVNILRYNKLVFIIVGIVIAIVLSVIAGLAISYRRKRNRKATISGWSRIANYKNMSFDERSLAESTGQDLKSQTDAVTILMQNSSKVNPFPDVNHL